MSTVETQQATKAFTVVSKQNVNYTDNTVQFQCWPGMDYDCRLQLNERASARNE